MTCLSYGQFNRAFTHTRSRSLFLLSNSSFHTKSSCRSLSTLRISTYNVDRTPSPLHTFTPSKRRNFWSSSSANSTAPTSATPPVPPVTISEATDVANASSPDDLMTAVDTATTTLSSHALEFGTLKSLGLASSFTPVGWIQSLLEAINVTTGLPWYTTIILTTTAVRLVGLPFTLRSTRASANMVPIRSKYEGLMNDLKTAAQSGDAMKRNLVALQIRSLQKEHGISPWNLMQGPIVQVVSSIAGFIAIKRLCDLPLAQLQAEGMAWIPSLAAADPTYLLPVLSVVAMNIQMRLGRVDVLASGSKAALHFGNVFPVLSVASLAVLSFLPSGVLLHLLTNITLISIQSAFLRTPAIRTKLKLPPLRKPGPGEIPTFRDTINAVKAWFSENKRQAIEAAEQRAKEKQVMFPAKPDSRRNIRRRS